MSGDAATVVLPSRSPGLRLRLPGGRGAAGLGAAPPRSAWAAFPPGRCWRVRAPPSRAMCRRRARAGHSARAREVRVSPHPHPRRLRHRDGTLSVGVRRPSDLPRARTGESAGVAGRPGPVGVRPGGYGAPHVDVDPGRAVSVAPRPARVRRPCLPGTLGCSTWSSTRWCYGGSRGQGRARGRGCPLAGAVPLARAARAHAAPAGDRLAAAAEAAIDQAWMEMLRNGRAATTTGSIQRHWERLAYLRARNGIRERRQHPADDVDELGETDALSDCGSGGGIAALETARTDARVREIVCQVGGDGRRWLEATLDDPGVPPQVLAQRLGWAPEKLKLSRAGTHGQLREFVSARASGVICERRQAVVDAFAATCLVPADPAHAARLEEHPTLGPERCEQVALHVAGCEECERAWRKAEDSCCGRALCSSPVALAGKLARDQWVGDRGGTPCAGEARSAVLRICGCESGQAWGGRPPVEQRALLAPPGRWRVRAPRCALVCCARPAWAPPRSWVSRRASSLHELSLIITTTGSWSAIATLRLPPP